MLTKKTLIFLCAVCVLVVNAFDLQDLLGGAQG
jgi:hypothetical protein